MPQQIKLFDPFIDKNEEFAILKALRSHFWASGAGTGYVSEFEQKFNQYCGSKECVAVNSGTAALHLALSLLDIKGKEVIVPSLSFVSTAHAVVYNGGRPIFVDVDEETLTLDPSLVKESMTEKTRVILPVHFGGYPCNLDKIKKIRNSHITIVEDAAHATGATYKNKRIGSHNLVCFSFHPIKNLAMPTGGAITLNGRKSNMYKKILQSKRWCGISDRNGIEYDVGYLGWNYYMNEFSAAIGIQQLKKLDSMNKKRKETAKRYNQEIKTEIKMLFNNKCSYHLYWIQVKNRNQFIQKMSEVKIETGIHYRPIHTMNFYKGKHNLPITQRIAEHIVSIPIHPNLTESQISKIIKSVNQFS